MENVTILVNPTMMIVKDGRSKGARLVFQAPGLDIYVFGACPKHRLDDLNYHALNQCKLRNIPMISLRRVGK